MLPVHCQNASDHILHFVAGNFLPKLMAEWTRYTFKFDSFADFVLYHHLYGFLFSLVICILQASACSPNVIS